MGLSIAGSGGGAAGLYISAARVGFSAVGMGGGAAGLDIRAAGVGLGTGVAWPGSGTCYHFLCPQFDHGYCFKATYRFTSF